MLFSKKPKDQLSLILDIQSSIIRGSLVLSRTGSVPVIVSTYSIDIPYKPRIEGSFLIKMTLEAISNIIEMVRNELRTHTRTTGRPHNVSEVHYVLSSPWVISQAKTLSYTFERPTAVKKAHILEAISKERTRISAGHSSKLKIVEEKICNVKLNGYSVAEWDNKESREFEVAFVSSVADHAMIGKFEKACSALGHHPKFAFHSSLLLQYIGIQNTIPALTDYILIHVHGELTDVATVSRHACTFFGSYPFGTHTLVRKLAKLEKIDRHAAESMLALHANNHLDRTHNKRGTDKLNDLMQEWGSELKKIFKEAGLAPTTESFLVSAKAHEELFKSSLKHMYAKNRVELLTIDEFKKHVIFQPQAEKLRLSGLYAIAIGSLEN